MITYDAHDGYVLLFGGFDGGTTTYGDTWTFRNQTWSDISASQTTSPGARYLAAMAYDPIDKYVVLFGGRYAGNASDYSDTWTFANGSWKEITSTLTIHPSERWRPNMVFDAADGYLLLFGGSNVGASYFHNDTWTFVHGAWSNITSATTGHPTGRVRFNLAYDAKDRYVVLFGGCTSVTSGMCNSNETWKYSAKAWTDLTPTIGKSPAARVYAFMTYDNATGAVVLFGGDTWSADNAPYRDTWQFTNGSWSDLSSTLPQAPSARGYGFMTYTPEGFVLLFGGSTSASAGSKLFTDSWAFGPGLFAELFVTPRTTDGNLTVRFTAPAFSSYAPLNYSYASLPPGCSSKNVSTLNCTPTFAGNYSVRVSVRDTRGDVLNRTTNLTVLQDPVVRTFQSSVASLDQGKWFNLTTSLVGGAPPYTYEYANLPRPCPSINASTLTCQPEVNGTFQIRLRAFDLLGYVVYANLTVVVNALPRVTSFDVSPGVTDVNLSVSFVASVAFGSAPYTYDYSGLPPGCLSANSSRVVCRPLQAGFFPVVVNVTDSSGVWNLSTAKLTVNRAFVLTSFVVAPTTIDLGQSVTFSVRYAGGTGSPTFAYRTAALGCGAGSGPTASCIPTQVGTFNVTATGTDAAGGQANLTTAVTVNDNPWVSQVVASPSVVDVGQPFTINVTIGGGTPPFTWAFSGLPVNCGTPSGLVFSCTPLVAGVIELKVSVTDHLGRHNSSGLFAVEVHPEPRIVAFTTSSPNGLTLGYSTTFFVNVTGGTGAFRYTYRGLPPGCSSPGGESWNCTPTAAGSYQVSVNATDLAGRSTTASTWLNVTHPVASTSAFSWTSETTLVSILVGVIAGVLAGVGIAAAVGRRRRPPPEEAVQSEAPAVAQPERAPWDEG